MAVITLLNLVHRQLWQFGQGMEADDGFSTAELLGNAALGIAALVVIWAGMEALGVEVMTWIRGQLIS